MSAAVQPGVSTAARLQLGQVRQMRRSGRSNGTDETPEWDRWDTRTKSDQHLALGSAWIRTISAITVARGW
jgi:hypothetical protein